MARLTPPPPPALGADLRSELLQPTGEVVPNRFLVNNHSTTGVLTQRLLLNYFKAKRTATINNLTLLSGGTAAAATPTLIRMGVYSIAANGDATLVASTPNDTALFAATFTAYTKALSAPWAKQAGVEYALGLLIVTAAAVPTIAGWMPVATGIQGTENTRAPKLVDSKNGQADLPASITSYDAVGGAGAVHYWRMS